MPLLPAATILYPKLCFLLNPNVSVTNHHLCKKPQLESRGSFFTPPTPLLQPQSFDSLHPKDFYVKHYLNWIPRSLTSAFTDEAHITWASEILSEVVTLLFNLP